MLARFSCEGIVITHGCLAQAGCGWSVAAGTGLVVARKGEQGGWSPPSALGLYSLGWGLQMGGSLCDLLIVLRNQWVSGLMREQLPPADSLSH